MPPRVDPALALALTAAGSWLWGSFLNQIVDRTPRRAAPGVGPPVGVTLTHPSRSVCFGCGRRIPWFENIPVVSYLQLRGRCSGCGVPIGVRTLWLEAVTPASLVCWHVVTLVLGATIGLLFWGFAALSWGLVFAVLILERRRIGWAHGVVGVALVAAALVALP